MSKTPRTVRQITIRPPITPPTMGPMFVELPPVGAGVELDVDNGNGTSEKVVELKVKGVDVGVIDVDGCGVGLAEEVLRIELEVDVVVASTVFGTANRLSVAARFPQAM
jgi:hypothetical protein